MHVHVALLPAWCTHVSCSVMYTFSANKSDGGENRAKKFPLAVPSAFLHIIREYVQWTWTYTHLQRYRRG